MISGMLSDGAMTKRVSSFRVMAAGVWWRMFGSRRAGDALLAAVSDGDEQARMLAGMALVKAGQRSFDLIQQKIEAGQVSENELRLLPDIDGLRARKLLEPIACGEDGELQKAAQECVDLLNRIDSQ